MKSVFVMKVTTYLLAGVELIHAQKVIRTDTLFLKNYLQSFGTKMFIKDGVSACI